MPLLPIRLRIILLVLLAAPLALHVPRGRAAPLPPRPDGLDTPLLAANLCGADAPGETHFTLAATGDIFPHDKIQAAGEAHGYDYLFDYVRPYLHAADLAYSNFEGAMLASSPHTGYPRFNYNPKFAPALKRAGIGVVSTANNHILDRGPVGLDATLQVLQQAGIMQHGTVPRTATQTPRPPYLPIKLTRGGVTITAAFMSFSWGTNGLPDPYGQVNLLWQTNIYDQQGPVRQSVLDAIAQAKRETDVVIVAAHWGHEYQFYPEAAQVEGAKALAAAGADVILGAQSHTLQPVDIIDTHGRKTLVIYSLANFLAAQGAFQAQSYTATATIFYVGLIRGADGHVRVSGYRYLPTIHVDGDTRPAPIAAGTLPGVQAHVHLMMRDPGGVHQVPPDPQAPGAHLEVCPRYTILGAADRPIGGDFAQALATLGSGTTLHPPEEVRVVFGPPLGRAKQELAGDCRRTTWVLYTERQRLEWQPDQNWSVRVAGTALGTALYQQKYGVHSAQRRLNLAGDAIGNDRFRQFFRAYGGVGVFGYPISGVLTEQDSVTGQAKTVQYFERARFELIPNAPPNAGLLAQVHLGSLSQEYPGIAAQCAAQGAPGGQPAVAAGSARGIPLSAAPAGKAAPLPARPRSGAVRQPPTAKSPARLQPSNDGTDRSAGMAFSQGRWNWIPFALGGVLLLGLVGGSALWWRSQSGRP